MSSSLQAKSNDGTLISYDRAGSGPALILVEPAGHYRAFSAFDALAPLLAPDFSVIRYDRRGRGLSGDTPPYDPSREVEDLAALIAAVGRQAFVYGYSSGALVALHAAAGGAPVEGMVLLEPPLQQGAKAGPDPLTGELAALVQAGRHDDAVTHFHAAIGVPQEMVDEMRGSAAWAKMVGIAPTLVHDCMLSDAMGPDICRAVTAPVLVLDSEGSSDDLTSSSAQAARLIPNARYKSLPGEWHTVAPDLIAAEIRRFFGAVA